MAAVPQNGLPHLGWPGTMMRGIRVLIHLLGEAVWSAWKPRLPERCYQTGTLTRHGSEYRSAHGRNLRQPARSVAHQPRRCRVAAARGSVCAADPALAAPP